MSDNNNKDSHVPAFQRRYAGGNLNEAFNEFLQIGPADIQLLRDYRETLLAGSEHFTKIFYSYLESYPATAKTLDYYEAHGGKIEDLVAKQTQHLANLLAAETGDAAAQRLEHIGHVHYRYRIEPPWIMGAYLLYLEHLQGLIRTGDRVQANDRAALDSAVTKLLFRDMGLMLEGYWNAAGEALQNEQEKVVDLQQQITSLLANIPQLLWSVDIVNNRPLYVSPSAREICDMSIDMPIPCLAWTIPEDRETVRLAWEKTLAGHKVEVESRVQTPEGGQRWFRRVFYPALDRQGRVVRVDGLMEDTTESKLMVERLHALATTDNLTGLPNRALFNDRLAQALTAASRREHGHVALLLMDLNHFKEINDTLGHPAGDRLLTLVAQRLALTLRDSDTIARLGGDEFGILLPDLTDGHKVVDKVARKLLHCFVAPFRVGDNELYLGASIGAALCPEHGEDMNTLMSRADVAMYLAKTKDAGYLFYDAALDPNVQSHLQLSADLRQAIGRRELELYYQPRVNLRTGDVEGAEALIRWHHPQHGTLLPDQFIPLAERSGLIRPITDWLMETAVAQCQQWRGDGHPLRVSVNMSGRVFYDPHLVPRIERLLAANSASAECLEIEIVENVLMADVDHVSRTLDRISGLGIHIAIDDFGTGYSSLAYLKKLPLQTLKIDKSFVLDMAQDENDATIVRSTIDLAHNLGYRVVAEGIENPITHRMLVELGCDGAQGFHFSHPIPAKEFTRLYARA